MTALDLVALNNIILKKNAFSLCLYAQLQKTLGYRGEVCRTKTGTVVQQSAIALNVLPAARGTRNLQRTEVPESTWVRKYMMPARELEEQLTCWLWKDDCSAVKLWQEEWDLEPKGQPIPGETSPCGYLYISSQVQNGGQAVTGKPYIVSSPVKRCMPGDASAHTVFHHAGMPPHPHPCITQA